MYKTLMTWEFIRDQLGYYGTQIENAVDNGKKLYDKWYSLTYGLTDVQILALTQFSTMTQAELTDIKAAMQSINQINSGLYGIEALGAYNRSTALEQFI